jgi:alkylation response protein AidB-like acyl-CoA dehydrogenase
VDFRLTPEQRELQEHVRAYCARVFVPEHFAAMEGVGIDRHGWEALGALGVFALRVPEADGGLGLGWVEVVAAYEVLGYHLVPGPLVWSQLLAGVLPAVDSGAVAVTGVDLAVPATPIVVEHADMAHVVVLVDDDGATVVEGTVRSRPPLDPLTPVGVLGAFRRNAVVVAAADVPRLRAEGAAVVGALMVGVAERALDAARDYALEREQFDRPIGAFQAVQHLLADMYVRVMLARSAAYAAAAVLDDPGTGDLTTAVGSVKVVAGDAALANSRSCIQVHGGMGFTWEMIPHYLLKRAWVLEHAFGPTATHAEHLAATLGV